MIRGNHNQTTGESEERIISEIRGCPRGIAVHRLARRIGMSTGSLQSRIDTMTYAYPLAEDDNGRISLAEDWGGYEA